MKFSYFLGLLFFLFYLGSGFLFAQDIIYIKAGKLFYDQEIKENKIIVIEDNLIKEILDEPVVIPTNTIVISAEKYTVLPGFIDTNTHFFSPPNEHIKNLFEKGHSYLYTEYLSNMADARKNSLINGITSVYDVGDNIEDLIEITNLETKKNLKTPEIYFSGPLFTVANGYKEGILYSKSHYFYQTGIFEVKNIPMAIKKILELKKQGVSFISIAYTKKNNSLDLATAKAIINQAHLLNLPVFAIVDTDIAVLEMINAGIDAIEHCFSITCPENLDNLLDLMSEKKVVFTPNLLSVKNNDSENLSNALFLVHKAFEKKVPISIGSNFPIPGNDLPTSYFQEIELLHSAGLSNLDVINSVTKIAGTKIKKESFLGVIKPNATANFIFYQGDIKDKFKPENIKEVWLKGEKIVENKSILNSQEKYFTKQTFTLYPKIAYSTDLGFSLGAGINNYSLFDKYFQTDIDYSYYLTNQASNFDIRTEIPSNTKGLSVVNLESHYDNIKHKFFGINNNKSDNKYKLYRHSLINLDLDFKNDIQNNLFFDTSLYLENRTIVDFTEPILGATGGFLPMISFGIIYDTRDNTYNPW